ncbi:MAG: hypothetical protein ACXVYV_04545 [Gaiellales bacterium]
MQEILAPPEFSQLLQGEFAVVAAGDRVQDAALVEGFQDVDDPRPQRHLAILEHDAASVRAGA